MNIGAILSVKGSIFGNKKKMEFCKICRVLGFIVSIKVDFRVVVVVAFKGLM